MSTATLAQSGPLLAAIGISAAAGAISFATPCVLPLVPGYLAFVSGLSGPDQATRPAAPPSSGEHSQRSSLVGACLFVLGFTTIFTLLGGAFGALGHALADHRQLIDVVGGLLVVAMGLFMLGVLRPPALQRDSRPWQVVHRGGLLGAFPLGVVFGAGWTPCIGPTLASILTLSAAGHTSAARGVLLALSYSLGLGVPLIALALGLTRALRGATVLRRHSRWIEITGGVLLTIVGVLLLTGVWATALDALRPWFGHFTSPI